MVSNSLEKLIDKLISVVPNPSVAFTLWDGKALQYYSGEKPKLHINIKDKEGVLNLLLSPNDLAVTEAYFNDYFDFDGDLHEAVRIGEHVAGYKWSTMQLAQMAGSAVSLGVAAVLQKAGKAYSGTGTLHSVTRDKEAIAYHYDTSNEFFALWLDPRMVYSGAYFPSADVSLEAAQEYKLDLICKKLHLQPGETLLDIGCGWGSLVMFAAKNYRVKAKGISLSKKQVEYAQQRIKAEGLEELCSVEYADYRELPEGELYDKISSVEMLHHVGSEMLGEYFATIKKHLKPKGISFQLSVTSVPAKGKKANPQFVDKYFQPDYHLMPISALLAHAEQAGFEVQDVENVRMHYYLTSKHWLQRLEAAHDAIVREVNEFTYRVLRLGLFVMMVGFKQGDAGFYHFVLLNNKADISQLPLKRQV